MIMCKGLLIGDARRLGICAEGFGKMSRAASKDELVDYYVQNPDWCLERDFPTMQILTDSFSDCEDKGVFVDKTFHGEVLNDLQAYVFHNCKGTIKVSLNVEKAIIPMLYLANGCRLRIVGTGEVVPKRPMEVPVYVFGQNDYSAKDNKFVKFNIYKHKLL